MPITSVAFSGFVVAVLMVYHLLPGRSQRVWLLVSSYAFAATWSWTGAAILLLLTALNYRVALALRVNDGVRQSLLWAGIGLNLFVLLLWKYARPGQSVATTGVATPP